MPPKKGKKGKGKKGKKGKKEKKEEPVEKRCAANQKIWEARLKTIEKTKDRFKESAEIMGERHDGMLTQMKQIELDTIDVITFLRNQDTKKSDELEKLEKELQKLMKQNEKEKATLAEDYQDQIRQLQTQINKKQDDIIIMNNELKHVKEFRKKRAAMQRELDEIKDGMFLADRQHKEDTEGMIDKFETEKKEMQMETNERISELADRAHQQAITNLDEQTRSIYKENVRLTEALKFHKSDENLFLKTNAALESENLKTQEEITVIAQEGKIKVAESQKQRIEIEKLEAKMKAIELALNRVSHNHKADMRNIKRQASVEKESSQVELIKLARLLELKSEETCKVKKLARNLLAKRTDIEQDFLDSLQDSITQLSIEHGVNPKKISVSTLPWYEKERVLRRLFIKMNQTSDRSKRLPPPEIQEQQQQRIPDMLIEPDSYADETFLTQAELDDLTTAALDM